MSHGRSMTFRTDDCPPKERAYKRPPTFKEIGVELGVSHETVRHIETMALEKIRDVMDQPPHLKARRDIAHERALRAVAKVIAQADTDKGSLIFAMVQVFRAEFILAWEDGNKARRRGTDSTEAAA